MDDGTVPNELLVVGATTIALFRLPPFCLRPSRFSLARPAALVRQDHPAFRKAQQASRKRLQLLCL